MFVKLAHGKRDGFLFLFLMLNQDFEAARFTYWFSDDDLGMHGTFGG